MPPSNPTTAAESARSSSTPSTTCSGHSAPATIYFGKSPSPSRNYALVTAPGPPAAMSLAGSLTRLQAHCTYRNTDNYAYIKSSTPSLCHNAAPASSGGTRSLESSGPWPLPFQVPTTFSVPCNRPFQPRHDYAYPLIRAPTPPYVTSNVWQPTSHPGPHELLSSSHSDPSQKATMTPMMSAREVSGSSCHP